jgi:hypothetical protein
VSIELRGEATSKPDAIYKKGGGGGRPRNSKMAILAVFYLQTQNARLRLLLIFNLKNKIVELIVE